MELIWIPLDYKLIKSKIGVLIKSLQWKKIADNKVKEYYYWNWKFFRSDVQTIRVIKSSSFKNHVKMFCNQLSITQVQYFFNFLIVGCVIIALHIFYLRVKIKRLKTVCWKEDWDSVNFCSTNF